MNSTKIIYQEKKTSKMIIIVFSLATLFFSFAFIYQGVLKLGLIGTNPAPDWFYPIFAIFMISCLLVFKTVKITITNEEIMVGFNNFFVQKIKFQDIEKVAIDDKSYGGSGIRVRFVKGILRIAYNVGPPRLVVSLKNKRKEIAFSTNNPERVIKIIESRIYFNTNTKTS